ncbi:4'-phosphopantetheinyl transferase superfamily protein [Muricauda sp. 2012CJ35-5]|uniref:4'-phosphopantetheinyl transferase superfamily protein n=1 Tax=Flagellimonas spongiicola TaxID=2942208 RepID=A0ABT0PRF4_9FLAO|nr:4'-phosphopantetheinyl transferase family protein [Allomuricauda spongiicola]MCL6273980.1 4'-phosphopantetheinyl transferase superfamily protein [Allomuricauda spongiicola]
MPLYKTITVSPTTSVYIWKVTELEEELSKDVVLTDHCANRMNSMKSEFHRRAFLSIRHLMKEADYVDHDLYYDDFGKPHLHDGNHISITHSHNFTGIIVSSTDEVGIDIEMQRDKILRIANKFTPLEEYRTLANTEAIIRKLTIVWGAKESLYKIYAQQGLSFLKHIDVMDFAFDDKRTVAKITHQGNKSHYGIEFLEFEGFTCVFAQKMMGR